VTINRQIIRLSKSCIGSAEKRAVMDVLDREFLGMGTEVSRFERALSDFFGRPAACVVNGTAALHLSVQACGIGVGDEVLVPSLTYIASFQAISATGATPVACDVSPESCVIDWQDAQKRLSPRTKAIMPVYYAGGAGERDRIYAFAKRHSLRVIEDAAHAFGTTYHGNRIGSFGDISCFSFDGIKNITSGEGGCIVSDDRALMDYVRDARLLGVQNDSEKRCNNQRSWQFDVMAQGWRYHMSDIMAAIGLEQLKRFPVVAGKRQELAKYYDSMWFDCDCIQPLIAQDYEEVVPHIYVVRIKGMQDRAILQEKLLEAEIQTGYHYYPNHRLSLYQNESSIPLPATDNLFPEILTLPLHPELSKSDVDYISSTLKGLVA